MTKIIPPELIKHLEWNQDNEALWQAQKRTASIDELISNGRVFSSRELDIGHNQIGLAVALQEAYDNMGPDAIVASMPYLISGKANAYGNNYLLRGKYNTLSEEDVGIDRSGRLVGKGQGIVITVHGGGILTPGRIFEAYYGGLTQCGTAKYNDWEFDNLLKGTLPSGESIELYTVDDVKKGRIPEPFGRYGIWMSAEIAQSKPPHYYSKDEFMNNELVIARAGTLEYLEKYFDKAKGKSIEKVGNFHKLHKINLRQPQGILTSVYTDSEGLNSRSNLNNSGCFVAVAPEAQR